MSPMVSSWLLTTDWPIKAGEQIVVRLLGDRNRRPSDAAADLCAAGMIETGASDD